MRVAHKALAFAPELRQLHKNPEGNHEGEADSHKRVGESRAECDGARGAVLREVARPIHGGGLHVGDECADGLVLEHVGVARVHVVRPVRDALHVDRDVLDQVRELGIHANARREQKECHERQHREHDHVTDGRAHRSVDADFLELVHRAAQDEHDDGRPDDNGDGHRKDVQKLHNDPSERNGAHDRPNV